MLYLINMGIISDIEIIRCKDCVNIENPFSKRENGFCGLICMRVQGTYRFGLFILFVIHTFDFLIAEQPLENTHIVHETHEHIWIAGNSP